MTLLYPNTNNPWYTPPYQHLLTNINPHTREHYITPILTIMRKYLKFRILAGVGHNHHPTAAVPYHRGYTPPICLILNTFCGLRFCAYFFTIYVIYSSVWSRVRSLYRVICVGGKWKFTYLWLYIWGVERDSASERIKPDKFAFDGRS